MTATAHERPLSVAQTGSPVHSDNSDAPHSQHLSLKLGGPGASPETPPEPPSIANLLASMHMQPSSTFPFLMADAHNSSAFLSSSPIASAAMITSAASQRSKSQHSADLQNLDSNPTSRSNSQVMSVVTERAPSFSTLQPPSFNHLIPQPLSFGSFVAVAQGASTQPPSLGSSQPVAQHSTGQAIDLLTYMATNVDQADMRDVTSRGAHRRPYSLPQLQGAAGTSLTFSARGTMHSDASDPLHPRTSASYGLVRGQIAATSLSGVSQTHTQPQEQPRQQATLLDEAVLAAHTAGTAPAHSRPVKNVSWSTQAPQVQTLSTLGGTRTPECVEWDGMGRIAQAAAQHAATSALQSNPHAAPHERQPPAVAPAAGAAAAALAGRDKASAHPQVSFLLAHLQALQAGAGGVPVTHSPGGGAAGVAGLGTTLLDYVLTQDPNDSLHGGDAAAALAAAAAAPEQSLYDDLSRSSLVASWAPKAGPRYRWLQDYLDLLGRDGDDKHVFVASKRLSVEALGMVSGFLAAAPRVRAITLVYVGLDDQGAFELALGLRQSYGDLWSLDLRHNKIGNKGALALSSCLSYCPGLREVVLSHNCIGDEGVSALADAVASNDTPVRVRVSHNPCSSESAKELHTAYKMCRQKRARNQKSLLAQLQQLERAALDGQAAMDSSPTEGIFDNVLAKESEEDQLLQPTLAQNLGPGSSLSLGPALPPVPPPSLRNQPHQKLRSLSAIPLSYGSRAYAAHLGPTSDGGANTATGPGGVPCPLPPQWRSLRRSTAGPGSGAGTGNASPVGVSRRMLTLPGPPAAKGGLVGLDDLDQICSLLKLLFAPTLPEEHTIAQDVGAALLDLPSLTTPTLPRTLSTGRGLTSTGPLNSPTADVLRGAAAVLPSGSSPGAAGDAQAPTPRAARTSSLLMRHCSAEHLQPRKPDNATVQEGVTASRQGSLSASGVDRILPPLLGDDLQGAATELEKLADALCSKCHDAVVTTSYGGGSGGDCLQNLRHTYIAIQVPLRPVGYESSVDHGSFDAPGSPVSQHATDLQSEIASLSGFSIAVEDLSGVSRPLTRNVSVNSMHGMAVFAAANDSRGGVSPQLAPPPVHDSSTHSGKGYAHWVAVRDDSTHSGRSYSIWAGVRDESAHGGTALAQISELGPAEGSDHGVKGAPLVATTPVPLRPAGSVRGVRSTLSGSLRGQSPSRRDAHGSTGGTPRAPTGPSGGQPASLQRSVSRSQLHASPPAVVKEPTTARILVDPGFKEQFEIGKHTTERYDAILSVLPRVYVGREERMSLLVELLCEEMSNAFKERGLPLPPWRRASSLMSKWKQRSSMAVP